MKTRNQLIEEYLWITSPLRTTKLKINEESRDSPDKSGKNPLTYESSAKFEDQKETTK